MIIIITKLIINGRSLTGKDVIANYLVENYGFKKITFATPIYDIARKYFGMKIKDRWLLQQIGQKFREIKSSIWIDYALKIATKYDKCVISDCRQSNEYETCVNNGFVPIRVNADFNLRVQRAIKRDGSYPDTTLWENESEIGADNYPYIEIDNNGTFEELYTQIEKVLKMNIKDLMKEGII